MEKMPSLESNISFACFILIMLLGSNNFRYPPNKFVYACVAATTTAFLMWRALSSWKEVRETEGFCFGKNKLITSIKSKPTKLKRHPRMSFLVSY